MHELQNLFNEISFSTSSHPRDNTNKRVLQSTIHSILLITIKNNTNRKPKNFFTRNIFLHSTEIFHCGMAPEKKLCLRDTISNIVGYNVTRHLVMAKPIRRVMVNAS